MINASHSFLLLEASAVSGTADSEGSCRIMKKAMLFLPSFPF